MKPVLSNFCTSSSAVSLFSSPSLRFFWETGFASLHMTVYVTCLKDQYPTYPWTSKQIDPCCRSTFSLFFQLLPRSNILLIVCFGLLHQVATLPHYLWVPFWLYHLSWGRGSLWLPSFGSRLSGMMSRSASISDWPHNILGPFVDRRGWLPLPLLSMKLHGKVWYRNNST